MTLLGDELGLLDQFIELLEDLREILA